MTTSSFTIQLVGSEDACQPWLTAVQARRGTVLTLRAGGLADVSSLEQSLLRVFQIPYPSVGFDSIIDFGSSLDEWMESPGGFLFVVRGIDLCPDEVQRTIAEILPYMIDRWRSIGHHYDAVIAATASRPVLLEALRTSNDKLRQAGDEPYNATFIGPVRVYVDGVLDEVASAGARPSQ